MDINKIDIDDTFNNKLTPIHESLKNFSPKYRLKDELPEQLMACNFIKEDDCVLELGGSIGRNSCVINTLLKNKGNHLVIEPNPIEASGLKYNKVENNLDFKIEVSAISDKPLYSRGWSTYTYQIPGSVLVNTLTYDQLLEKYDMLFNVLIIDAEGNFSPMLKSFPNILNNIRLIIIEHDFNSNEDLEYFVDVLTTNNFKMTCKYLKNDKYGPGNNWPDGLKNDPIFVSAWVR